MTLDPALIADALVNLFGAAGAFVLARETFRSDPHGPVTRRIDFALRFVAGLFLLRAIAWITRNPLAFHIADVLAASTPLVSLVVAEGLMRRHAPRWLKLALIAGPVLLILAKIVPYVPAEVAVAVLIVTVLGGYLGIAAFLWLRDVRSLTAAENSNIRRVLLALLVLASLIVTDFRSIWPDVPVRLGAVGALLLLYLGFGTGNLQASGWARAGTVAMFAVIASLFAAAYLASDRPGGMSHMVRVAVVGFSGLLFAAIFAEARGASSERNRPANRLIAAKTVEAFEGALREHPLLSGARILDGDALMHVQHSALDGLIAEHPVLRRAAAPWGRPSTDDGVERALSLMTAHDATDLALLTRNPMRLLALSLPVVARDARSEADVHLARLVGELVYTNAARP